MAGQNAGSQATARSNRPGLPSRSVGSWAVLRNKAAGIGAAEFHAAPAG